MAETIGAHGRRVIEALDAGRRFRRAEGAWRAGALAAPDSLVDALKRRDLVCEQGGVLALTAAGQGWSARAARPDLPGRLLAERAVPSEGEARQAASPERKRARSVTVNLAESPLGWLMARGYISARQHDAGERLRADWTIGGLGPRVTMRWDAAPQSRAARGPGGAVDPTLAQIAAKRRMEAALDAIGPGLRDIAWRLVCAGEGMESAEKALGWPARAGRVVLTMALDRLADFYRIA